MKKKISIQRFTICHAPEELEVQASLGQEKLVILLEPHLAHSSVLEERSAVRMFTFTESAKISILEKAHFSTTAQDDTAYFLTHLI